ncbi:MAG: hypothetical protein NUV34_04785, partial [Sulfuricaulis sp.]|nr:hypothetical protein [Sulfuricaulis sp.]
VADPRQVTFLCLSKEKSPAVGQPPTNTRGRWPLDNNTLPDCAALHPGYKTFEIARKARDNIQTLDPRFRGDDAWFM